MNDERLQTIEQVKQFLDGSEAVEFRGLTAKEKYYWIEEVLIRFRDKYRTAELHKYSAVRAFTSKDKWDHFQVEENIIKEVISDLTSFFVDRPA